MRTIRLLLVVGALSGCDWRGQNAATKPSIDEQIRQIELQTNPVGRFAPMGTRQYSNGTELYMLDTRNGRVCYALITNDGKPDTNRCTTTPAGAD